VIRENGRNVNESERVNVPFPALCAVVRAPRDYVHTDLQP
jgi:hypothetical protein